MSKAARKTKRIKRFVADPKPSIMVIDFIYRRVTGDTTGYAPIGKA